MKRKDIEKSLKKEHDGAKVPNVMRRAQKAPINRLLDGQRPLKAFDKQTAVRVLWIVMALAVTALLCFGALCIMDNGTSDKVNCAYVRVSIENGGEITEYGMVIEGVQNVALFVLEKSGSTLPMKDLQKGGNSLQNAINDVYQCKSGDKVSICVVASNVDENVAQDLKAAFSRENNTVTLALSNDSRVIESLKEYAQTTTNDLYNLVCAYFEKYRT